MYASGVKIAHCDQQSMDDGYIRTFRRKEIPEFSDLELKMINEWINLEQFDEIFLYLTSKKWKNLDNDMAGFVLREIMRGNL